MHMRPIDRLCVPASVNAFTGPVPTRHMWWCKGSREHENFCCTLGTYSGNYVFASLPCFYVRA